MIVVVLVRRVVGLSQYDSLVFIVMIRHLCVFRRFEQAKYIRSKTRNQINGHQYAAELESKVF